jgi:hypothetical protein
MAPRYDRTVEDLGNIVGLEHVNVQVPDQHLANLFYVVGLGLTRDPYLMVADNNMWINVGRSQFHLPTGQAQRLRGHVGLVIEGREALLKRLAGLGKKLAGTSFGFTERNDCVEAVSPWGNRLRCHEPNEARFGRVTLGMPYVEFDVPPGAAAGIGRFYAQIFDAPAETSEDQEGRFAKVLVGKNQHLVFRETDRPQEAYDEHHVQIYVVNFSTPYRRLIAKDLLSREDNHYQYRFRDIVDLENGKQLFTIEHEVRSMTHPLFARPLINRNPQQTNRNYAQGHDQFLWAMNPDQWDDRVATS